VDAGSSFIKVALLDDQSDLIGVELIRNKGNRLLMIDELIASFLSRFNEKICNIEICACGYGRDRVKSNKKLITEITAIAAGVASMNNGIEAIIDIGGQDFKVIKIDPSSGKVLQFYMNDKCSSGTGAFIETMLERLDIPFDQIDSHYYEGIERVNLSSICTVFATSEVIGHLADGKPVESVLRGAIDIIVRQIGPLIKKFHGIESYTITGGLSGVKGLTDAFSNELKLDHVPLKNAWYIGAIGAATYIAKKRNTVK
jgi:predicted CoA-substrate-specific enzyme activase